MILLYGANGFTGRLIARLAKQKGLAITLAGRSKAAILDLGKDLDFPISVFSLSEIGDLSRFQVVLNCAGPFSKTASSWMKACIDQGIHYLDITGEISVFETAIGLSDLARNRGIVLMPGVGFDVVPTDCLAAHLKSEMPDATHLELAFWAHSGPSSGTVKSMIESIPIGGRERIAGKLVGVSFFHKTKRIPFLSGVQDCAAIPWGDLVTAFASTQIPNIIVYSAYPKSIVTLSRLVDPLRGMVCSRPVQNMLKALAEVLVKGPSESEQQRSKIDLWAMATGPSGSKELKLQVPEGYRFTAHAALECAARVAKGDLKGFQTPAMAFGSDLLNKILASIPNP